MIPFINAVRNILKTNKEERRNEYLYLVKPISPKKLASTQSKTTLYPMRCPTDTPLKAILKNCMFYRNMLRNIDNDPVSQQEGCFSKKVDVVRV